MKEKYENIKNLKDAIEYTDEESDYTYQHDNIQKKPKKFKEGKDFEKGKKLNKRSYR